MVADSQYAVGALRSLRSLSEAVATAGSLGEIFEASLDCLALSLGVDRSSILLLDDQDVMRFHAWRGLSPEYRQAVEGHSPWAPDAVRPEPVVVPDVAADESLASLWEVLEREDIHAVAFIPLTVAGRLIGKFMLYYPAPHDFADEELLTAEVLGTQIGLAIDKFRGYDALARSEHRHRALVEAMGVAAYTTDEHGRIDFFNEQAVALWGRRPETGVDLWCGSWKMFTLDGEPLPHDQCPMALALRDGRVIRDVEIIAERPDGTRATVLPFPTPLHDASGRLIGAINVLMDITQRKQAEVERLELLAAERAARAAAEAAVRARDEFLSIASHELRNPVAAVRGSAQLLQRFADRQKLDALQVARYAESLVETSDRLGRLLDDLLDVARLETGQLALRTEPFDLAALVREVIEEAAEHLDGHEVVTRGLDEACEVVADPVRIRQVLANLVENALKYSPSGGMVTVGLLRGASDVTVEVTDQGIGFPPEAADQLFVPFARAANARDANIPGMGLGLHVGRQLAELHGGRLVASSEGEGRGARLALTLPTP